MGFRPAALVWMFAVLREPSSSCSLNVTTPPPPPAEMSPPLGEEAEGTRQNDCKTSESGAAVGAALENLHSRFRPLPLICLQSYASERVHVEVRSLPRHTAAPPARSPLTGINALSLIHFSHVSLNSKSCLIEIILKFTSL